MVSQLYWQLHCKRLLGRLMSVLMLSAILMPGTVWGQSSGQSERRTVAPGDAAKLTTLSVRPEALKTSLGSVDVKVSETDPETYDVVFLAPTDAEGKTAEVTFTVNGQPRSITVSVGPAGPWGAAYAPAFKVLFALFVLAVVLEWGLAVLFNWRWFLEVFDAKGLRTVISVLFAYWIVTQYDLDLMTRLINILWGTKYSSDYVSRFISALVLAGGSSGVNTMLVGLGFRSVRTAEAVQPKPPPTKAWVSVTVVRSETDGPLTLWLSRDGGANYAAVQEFQDAWRAPGRWWHYILRNPGRWPRYGGFTLDPGVSYALKIRGFKPDKTEVVNTWGPYLLAAGALIDIVLTA